MKFLVTGGAGFIGSALIRKLIQTTDHYVVNVDKLTYAANLEALDSVSGESRYKFFKVDICDATSIKEVFKAERPDVVIHLAAESHVDRSIKTPENFILSNIIGTYNLLEASRLIHKKNKDFLFHHVSTDEVYGDLNEYEPPFTEQNPYKPSSPYSASKASSDHLVRSWGRTYDLPFVLTNCSNNYGPFQHPEKLIPQTIINAVNGNKISIYGNGEQIRDWLHVDDHADGLIAVACRGSNGNTYNIGSCNEKKNIEVVKSICESMDNYYPQYLQNSTSYHELISFVRDRPGHDTRYAIDSSKIIKDLKWNPKIKFEEGLESTIKWYIQNQEWIGKILK